MRKIDLERRLSGKDILRTVKRSPVAIAVLVLLAVFPYLCSNIYLMNVVIEVFFFAALGVAWNVLGGLAKQISWASACFFTIGAYAGIMMYLSVKLSPWISMFIGIIAACLFALVLLCKQAAKIFQTICKKETALKRVLRNLLSAISFAQI